ncbi:MAG: hypothetical protein HMLIMOIP_000367 [Candidatus Nitrosomirales archaeon]
MRKVVGASIGGGIAVAIIIAVILMNFYALSNMQIRQRSIGNFDFVTFSMDMQLDACNPTPFPAYFDQYLFTIYYKGKEFATMTLQGTTIMPNQMITLKGNVAINTQMVAGMFIQAFANAFSGQEQETFNENDMTVKVTLDSKIIGLIPLSQSREFSFSEFKQLMTSQDTRGFSCA